jgi:hypothetical protein
MKIDWIYRLDSHTINRVQFHFLDGSIVPLAQIIALNA